MSIGLLIVDDDAEFRAELRDLLEGYEIYEAAGGKEALSILSLPNNIEVVLLDIRMPGPDGLHTLKEIRKTNSELGVIILTGFSTKNAAVEALKLRADDYLEKPSDIDYVPEAVERVAKSSKKYSGIDGDPSLRPGQVKRFIEKNISKKVTLRDAASSVFITPKYLSRYFKKETGKGFRDYKLEAKLGKAKKLLTETGISISSLSEKVGYGNVESFSRIFKKKVGMPPSAYRNRKRKKVEKRK
jgi:two-component system, response regulator YesN